MKEKRVEIWKKIKLFWNWLKVVIFHLKYNQIWRQGQFWWIPYEFFVFDDKIFNHQRFWYKFSHIHLLFYNAYKIYQHSMNSIDFIAPVYELFYKPYFKLIRRID